MALGQATIAAVCVYFIGEASGGDAVGTSSAINKQLAAAAADASPLASAGMWTDTFYVNTGAQLLTVVTSWGWTVAMLAVPAVFAYHAYTNLRGALKAMMPAAAAGAEGADGAAAGEGGHDTAAAAKRAEKWKKKQELAQKRAKGVRSMASGGGMAQKSAPGGM